MARKIKENPRYNVISLRISEEERKHLESLMEKTHMSVSHIMREAIEYFAVKHEHPKQTARQRN
jgi:predicted DNA-binding protein